MSETPSDAATDPPPSADDRTTACDPGAELEETLPADDVLAASVQLMKGFADGTRLRLLCLLRGREACVHTLVEALDVSQSAVSHQLRVLRDARLVTARREGRHVYYRLADQHVRELLDNALSHGAESA
jgi:ArsR family transcriptional regulator